MARFMTLDRVRITAVAMVFAFHVLRFGDLGAWHVKNPETAGWASDAVVFLSLVLMPVLFAVSGAAMSLGSRQGSQGQLSRSAVRLLIPFVIGTFLLGIPQVYVEAVTQRGYSGSLIAFLPSAFDGLYGFGGNFPWMGLHLWYLAVVFLFGLILRPLFKRLNSIGLQLRIRELTENTWWLYTPIVDLWLAETLLAPTLVLGRRDLGGWNLLVYLVVFLYGALYLAEPEIVNRYREYRFRGLFTGLAAGVGVLWLMHGNAIDPGWNREALILSGLRAISAWCLVTAWFGFMHRPFQSADVLVKRATPCVIHFYILHQPWIVFVGWGLSALPVPLPLKLILLGGCAGAAALASAVGLYRILRVFKRPGSDARRLYKG